MTIKDMSHNDWADLNVKDARIALSDVADDLRNPLRRARILEQWPSVTGAMDEVLVAWEQATKAASEFKEAAE